jgi:class 3 adenylate cyclase
MSAVKVEQSVELASPIDKVWPLIVDTDRMNRLMGLEPVRYTPIPPGSHSSARFLGETRIGGFRMVYEESPYEWTLEKEFGVYRKCTVGPLAYISMGWTLKPGDKAKGGFEGGTHLTVRFESEAKNALLKPFAWIGGRSTVKNILELGRAIDLHVRENAPSPFLEPVAPSDHEALARGVARLKERGVRLDLAERIGKHVQGCPDADAIRMRPFEIADEWGEPRREVLAAMLNAVPAGLVELRWAILCPSCRTASDQVPALDQITAEGHCQMCDIAFELDLDRAVEVTFFPHPTVRRVPDMMFCMGGPARTPHVLVQASIDAHEERTLDTPQKPGRYRIFSRGGGRATLELAEGRDPEATVRVKDDHVDPVEVSLSPGGKLTVVNQDDDARHVKIERLEYASSAATAHYVSTMEDFRNIFGGELLKRGTPLKVARVSILFSDLTGSTALYSQVGDAAAFRLVDDHFDVLREVIKGHDGIVVKTMGDAIMASFTDDEACVRAAIDCMAKFEAFRKDQKHADLTHVKIGVYSGPCYVITANNVLDYFGQTVNVASRLQHLAQSGEVIMLEEELPRLGDLRENVTVSAPEEVKVKGVDQLLRIVRVSIRPGKAA